MTTFDLLNDVGVVDWVIGNHADELIPWIPILSYPYPQTSVFLIPCCFYNINGTLNITPTSQHYSPDNFPLYLKDKKSRYVRYLEYICWILKGCGCYSNDGKSEADGEIRPDNVAWDVEFEILRIPSTKNVALIGLRNRSNTFAGVENHKVPDNDVWKVVNQLRQSGDVKVRISDREKTFLRLSKEREREKARECSRANETEC
ncbi:hypothetical protein BKA69DRAFT_1070513 [Paraphysoderma sedebokerense]|nr:hypothetical protein BKA69DRAFT_1070513 [Paraphysoderma sedebokerense]